MNYTPIDWQQHKTPINELNLDKMESGILEAFRLIEQLAGNQIPEEYLQACIDAYISKNKSGLATLTDLAEKIGYKTYVDKPIDFNTLLEPGIYNVLNSAVQTGESKNYPTTAGGLLIVFKRSDYDYPTIHMLVDNNNEFYTRYRTSSLWKDWKGYVSKEEFEALKNAFEQLKADYESAEKHIDGIGALVEVAETYFNVAYDPNDIMVYESKHGLFSPRYCATYNKEVDEDGNSTLVLALDEYGNHIKDEDGNPIYDAEKAVQYKAIVCSQFEQACIAGITYQNSQYSGKKNKALPWGFVSNGTGKYTYTHPYNDGIEDTSVYNDYMTACNQAKYFDEKGMLNTFDSMRGGLKAGDLLFYAEPSKVEEEDYYKFITHVGICLGADKIRYIMMHSTDNYIRYFEKNFNTSTKKWEIDENTKEQVEAGMEVKTYLYSTKSPDYYVRSPITAEYTVKTICSMELDKKKTYTDSSVFIGEFVFEQPLERGFYTLQFDDLGDSNGYIVVTYLNKKGQEGTLNYNAVKNIDINSVVFYAEMPVTKIYMRVTGGTHYDCSWAKLYKGYCP